MLPAAGQDEPVLLDGVEELDFDRPESWAMKYYTSLSLMTALGPPAETTPGAVELAFEGGLVPTLGAEKRRVGFVGDKVEDLNRTNVFGRFRVTVGLPRDLSLTVGVTPPVEVDGVTPELVSVALARPVHETPRWRLGLRLHGQVGAIEGDLTCPRDVVGLDDPELNPDGCLEPSRDEATQNYLGLEASLGRASAEGRWRPYVSVLANYLDLEFQVGARYSVFDDRQVLRTDGFTWGLTAGTTVRIAERWHGAAEVFYTPLEVVRDPTRGTQTDELVNARALLAYSWR